MAERHGSRKQGTEFEGRALARPDEELVDQGLGFDLGTLLNRRRMLGLLGLGAAGLGLAACAGDDNPPSASSSASASASTSSNEIPDETAGPYPGDGSNGPDVLEQSGIIRSDIRSSFGTANGTAEGVPMTMELTISDLAKNAAPFAGAAVYVWHCDRDGAYSMYSEGVEKENFLRGVQIADDSGKVKFTSIFPGCYPGRWPHVHFEVYATQADITDATKTIAISQLALPKDVCDKVYAQQGYQRSLQTLAGITLETDLIFKEDKAAHQLATVTGDATGYTAALTIGIDTRTTPTVF
ncbi:protocatechuate 3,4-dioxygenase beta subunit [Actinomadura pelletieri DSM 43383]|uniref:Protocatechuate 3,4-dioxygenase beta subunit n=1 Tax=Actinomadura pelletieri DSM 43383 TaxID=1120940 RepID=A0A495QZD7_9ACTN|nr:intradiol ring-cleavage dioxygenase [Actinomadura pelletieri]RKS79530.1 protocatechuate 3,4-dioxygenase beta subunit [Actinomadura pelletieri DSM 43383]